LEINKPAIIGRLKFLGAKDLGGQVLEETIFYDPRKKWLKEKKMVRLRKSSAGLFLAFKHTQKDSADGTLELEFKVRDFKKAKAFLENIGLKAFRVQQKRRHSFIYRNTKIDIDEHPKVPVYVEIEGPSEFDLKKAAKVLGLNWKDAHFESSRDFIEKIYKIPLTRLKIYTFDKVE
jgi:adenylate cyclase class 2